MSLTLEEQTIRSGLLFLRTLSEYDTNGIDVFLQSLNQSYPEIAKKITFYLLSHSSIPGKIVLKIPYSHNFPAVPFIKAVRSTFKTGLYEAKQLYDKAKDEPVELDCENVSAEDFQQFEKLVLDMGVLIL